MDSNQYVKRIVLTPNSEGATPVEWRTERKFEEYPLYFDDTFSRRVLTEPPISSIHGIRMDEWTVRIELEYREDFRKVASVVGKKKAAEVLRALGRPAPANWDRG
jgi:hypothetical protein